MKAYQKEFIEFALEKQVLKIGEFTLKSGRTSPYFFNAGLFNTGRDLARLGRFYAAALEDAGIEYDVLFGPAYKGIPLVTATAIKLSTLLGRAMPFSFNRKEVKDHGEGGQFVGAPLKGNVVIVDDVITAGTAIREVIALLEKEDECQIIGCLVALDRQEKGAKGQSAIQELSDQYGIKVKSIVCLNDLVDYVGTEQTLAAQYLPLIKDYREQFGISTV